MINPNQTLRRFYRWNAPIYDLTRWAILRGRRAAIDALRLRPGNGVLEIGCGTGLSFVSLVEQVGERGRVVGVDLSYHMLARARHRHRHNVHLIQADAARLALRCRFDAVLVSYALTMIPDWQAAIDRACNHLESGGTVVILDFARCDPPRARLRALFNRYLARNHVDTDRDLKGALARRMGRIEELDRVPAHVTLLRGTGLRSAG